MHLFLRQSIDSCLSCQFRLFFFYAVHHGALVRHSCCCTVLGVLWIPVEDYGCITFHAQSTAAPHFTLTVKSDVVHLIVVCWVLLLQSFVAERIVHTRWPTDFLFMRDQRSNPYQVFYVHLFRQQSADGCCVVCPCKVFCFHVACHSALLRRSLG